MALGSNLCDLFDYVLVLEAAEGGPQKVKIYTLLLFLTKRTHKTNQRETIVDSSIIKMCRTKIIKPKYAIWGLLRGSESGILSAQKFCIFLAKIT